MSRLVEQGSIALLSVIAAVESTPEEYAPFAFVLIITSLASVLASLGINLDALSQNNLRFGSSDRRRLLASSIVVAALPVAASAAGVGLGAMTAFALAAIWVGNAYGQIGKSVLIRDHRLGRHAAVDVVSAVVAWAWYLSVPGAPVGRAAMSIGLLFLVQAAMSFRSADVFGGGSTTRGLRILETQAAAVAVANVDYLAASVLLPAEQFSVYVLAFRLANSFNSQILHIVIRLFIRDYDATAADDIRRSRYRSGIATATGVGTVGMLATFPALLVVAHVAGEGWERIPVVGALLLVGLPARATTVVAGSVALASHAERRLLSFEMARLFVLFVAAFAGGLIGLSTLTAGVTLAVAINSLMFHYLLIKPFAIQPPRLVAAVSGAAVVGAALVYVFA